MSEFELVPCILGHGKGLGVVAVRRKEHARADLIWQVRRCSARRDKRDSRLLKYPPRVESIGGIRVTDAGSRVRIPLECALKLVGRPAYFACGIDRNQFDAAAQHPARGVELLNRQLGTLIARRAEYCLRAREVEGS